jgi:hypothetical protein
MKGDDCPQAKTVAAAKERKRLGHSFEGGTNRFEDPEV